MDISLILQMVLVAGIASVLYTLIGVAPGTDETAVLAPVTLVLVLAGFEPVIILTFFMAAIVAKKLTDSIPVAVAGIPGGVMSAPMVEHALVLKKHGLADTSIRKMASGSVIGTIVSIPISFALANVLSEFSEVIKEYTDPIFFFGAIFLALMTKNKWLALVSILPLALLIQGLRHLYWGVGIVPEDTTVFISFFLGITIGPVILTLFELLNGDLRSKLTRHDTKKISFKISKKIKGFPNPFRILTKNETVSSFFSSILGVGTFFLSPVGMTIMIGEVVASKIKDPVKKAARAISSMDALTNAAYISGTLIPLIALGIPLSPTAIGPGHALFNAPPVFTQDHNLHHILSMSEFFWATIIGAGIAILITYFVTVKYAVQICRFVFKRIPHEAMLGLFFGLVLLLAYMDAGWLNVAGVLLIGLVAGVLNRLGVNYGVQFMTLYAAPFIVNTLF
ncbi:hypothetical protein GCM10008986_33070 [Salinibacillus aidingensis]|uniref:DUF112 domain-containing protein n=1 Tax=Salinibacillus aidingensis TaxID=237684 RepID=A0ABN1BQ59_9BACI